MNEIRDILVGIDFGPEKSQICYYDRKENTPVSMPMRAGTSQYEASTCLCRKTHQKGWSFGIEAEYFAKEHGGILVEDLYGISDRDTSIQVQEEEKEPWELLSLFFGEMLKMLGILEPVKHIKCLVITTPALTQKRVENLRKACDQLGFAKGQFLLVDYSESFFYYALSQRPDTWNRNVAWYAFRPESVGFRKLSMNISTKPVLVRLEEEVRTPLSEEAVDRDIDFYQFIQHTMGTDLYSSVLITGEGFDTEWAEKSVPALCRQQRKVFYGNNLFAKGACYAAKEKLEDKRLKGYLYAGDALVKTNVGMELMIMGSKAYYPLIEAGNNWYDCSASCEVLLDNRKELTFLVNHMGNTEKDKISMALPGLPIRPPKATRLHIELNYTSVKDCVITVRDMGFGELYPSSQKTWKETVQW
ncbi:MAG TPA: hypothetical protein IAA45_11680 [Candidatus Blautia gallistercoris]|uniref:DUF5716 domain-containing protein n=1 Tax=Candidatus Blautia gallistercoris TaxID=2838490 RepID=A0A9D1WK85_9FIRM|nr:hypothetical protein [Candidatus Blautia gallistercoris]